MIASQATDLSDTGINFLADELPHVWPLFPLFLSHCAPDGFVQQAAHCIFVVRLLLIYDSSADSSEAF